MLAEQVSDNQETSTAKAKIFSEVDESDSHFVSILEREAGMIFYDSHSHFRSQV